MRSYVFVTETIDNLGGAQRYVFEKSRYLRNNNWEVIVIFSSAGTGILDFSKVESLHFPYLMCRPSLAPRKDKARMLQWLLERVVKSDEIIIESTSYDYSFWGEVIAKELRAKHLVFALDENPPALTSGEKSFLSFKLIRGELAGITKSCLSKIFPELSDDKLAKAILTAYQGSTVSSEEYNLSSLPEANFRIGTITRLEKSYVPKMVKSIVSFCRLHPDSSFSLIVIGDAASAKVKDDIISIASAAPNLAMRILGYMDPIPRNLVRSFDIAIGKAGSAWISVREEVPTAVYAMDEDCCMGLLGIDFLHSPSAKDGPAQNLEDIMESVLMSGDYRNGKAVGFSCIVSDFSKHFAFLGRSDKRESWFDVESVNTSFIRYVLSWVTKITGSYPRSLVRSVKKIFPGMGNC